MAKNVTAFLLTIVIIAGFVVLAIFGIGSMPGVFDENGIRKGLDLVGGSLIVYEADVEGNPEDLASNMKAVESMMRNRLDSLGYTEATATLMGDRRIRIEIPNIKDPEEAVQKLGSTAKLEFIDSDGKVVMEGKDIKKAASSYGDPTGIGYSVHFVQLQLQPDAIEKFSIATEAMSQPDKVAAQKNYISIMMDGKELSKPFVTEKLNLETCVITGKFDQQEAMWLANVISAGQLPFGLKEVQLDSVGPTLGEKALDTSLLAGAIGILLVMAYMILMYRLPGVISSIALVAYTAIMGLVLVIFKINLSLPGIAGIILSIGMAVDANVVIFERIKEELRVGKSTNAAVKSGFKRAFTAVLDSNVTTLIAAGVLWYFGTGPIQGFAITLFVGVILSMISAIFITRYLLLCIVGMHITNPVLYGVKPLTTVAQTTPAVAKKDKKATTSLNFVGKQKMSFLVVGIVLVIGIGSFFIRNFNIDTDFVGGTSFHFNIGQTFDNDKIAATVKDITGTEVTSIQKAGKDSQEVIIKTKELDTQMRDKVFETLKADYSLTDDDRLSVTNIGASVSEDLRNSAIFATVVAIVLMLLYITIRFAFLSGIAAIVCLTHDLFVMLVAYSIFQIPMNGTMIAAFLTILGYSINATIIIFDRVRENLKLNPSATFGENINLSIAQTLTRSVNTTITTLLTIGMVFILGVSSVRDFALPLIIGIGAGLFSSVCLAGPVWALLKSKLGKKKKA